MSVLICMKQYSRSLLMTLFFCLYFILTQSIYVKINSYAYNLKYELFSYISVFSFISFFIHLSIYSLFFDAGSHSPLQAGLEIAM
jgi:hypothetical protein